MSVNAKSAEDFVSDCHPDVCTTSLVRSKFNKRTNGPVNAHQRSAVYTNVIENSPSIEAGEALGPLFFSE